MLPDSLLPEPSARHPADLDHNKCSLGPRVIVACGIIRRQLSTSQARAMVMLGDMCTFSGNGGDALLPVTEKGQDFAKLL